MIYDTQGALYRSYLNASQSGGNKCGRSAELASAAADLACRASSAPKQPKEKSRGGVGSEDG